MNPSRRHPKTSWEPVSSWYHRHLREEDTLHAHVVHPGVLRLLEDVPHGNHLDLACGDGLFLSKWSIRHKRASALGIDASSSLIRAAKRRGLPNAEFVVRDAREPLPSSIKNSMASASCLLALQNIDPMEGVFFAAAQALIPGGAFVVVLNHPAFRQPRQSGWGWDEERKIQYRRVDRYLGEYEMPIEAHPGKAPGVKTYSYHRPLCDYIQAAANAGFAIDACEEWTSPKVSDSGPRAKAENIARNEIPLFLALRARRINLVQKNSSPSTID